MGERLRAAGERDAALPLLEEAVAVAREELEPDDPRLAHALGGLGEALAAEGRYAEAEPLLLESHAGLAAAPEVSAAELSRARDRLASLYEGWGRTQAAAEWRVPSAGAR